NPKNSLEEFIVKRFQGGKLARPTVSMEPKMPHNPMLARIAQEQQTKKKTKKPNVSAPIIPDQGFSSTDEENWPTVADIRTSYHQPTAYNSLPTAKPLTKGLNYSAMISAHASKELPLFSGQPNEDLLDWIEQFEKAFNVHRSSQVTDQNQRNQAKAHLLKSLLGEPAHSRVITELKFYNLDENDYDLLIAGLKSLYHNAATAKVARADLARLKQAPEESLASFASRLSKVIDRAYPQESTKALDKKKMEEFVTKIHPKIQVEIFGQNLTSFTGALQAGEQIELAHRAAGLSLDPTSMLTAFVPNNESERTPSPIRPPKVEHQANQPSTSQTYQERTERQPREITRTKQPQERMPTRKLVKGGGGQNMTGHTRSPVAPRQAASRQPDQKYAG
ncbi:MAG TPA: hypothetical protein VJS91_05255, partial [Nitrososphaeraceae archaeon]|nr:hypothetical protein [Nitrososphaeraceae archaeon]